MEHDQPKKRRLDSMASLNTDEEVQVEQGSQEMRSAELDELNEMDEFDESDELDRPLTPGSAGGLRPEADLISSSSRVSSNVGNMKPEQVGELIGIDLLDLAAAERHLVIDLIDLSTDPLNELYEKVYEAMLETKSDWSYPSSLAPDSLRKRFVLAAISQVTRWIKRQFNVDDRELKFDDEITFEVDFQGEWKYVTGGLVVCSKKKDAGAVVGENKHNRIKYHLAVVTNKMANCGEGLKQLLVYLRECYRLNNDNKPIYGFCSTATHFNLVRYNPKDAKEPLCSQGDFTVSESCRFLFGQMSEFKEDWMKDCTLFVRIIYTILYEGLELANKKK